MLNFITNPAEYRYYFFFGSGSFRRIFKTDMQLFSNFAQKNRAGLPGIVTDSNDIIK